MSPFLVEWRASRGEECQPGGNKIEDRFLYPLVYEPGSSWTYGPSIEWTGRIVERVNGGVSLEKYMQKNIWQPLGITDMTFFLQQRPDMLERRADLSDRAGDGSGKLVYADAQYWHEDYEDCFGGMGLFATPVEFMKIMHSLLLDDGKLLKPETVELLFQPQLTEKSRESLMNFYKDPTINEMMGTMTPLGLRKDYALGGLVLMENIPDVHWRRKGTMTWSGFPNVFWVIEVDSALVRQPLTSITSSSIEKQEYAPCTLHRSSHRVTRSHWNWLNYLKKRYMSNYKAYRSIMAAFSV